MSNLIAKFKRKDKRILKKELKKMHPTFNNRSTTSLDFGARILPDTILIDVKQSTMKVGKPGVPMKDIEPIIIGNTFEENVAFMNMIKTNYSSDTIKKVIMDNGDGFKIKTLDEFITDIENYLAKFQ